MIAECHWMLTFDDKVLAFQICDFNLYAADIHRHVYFYFDCLVYNTSLFKMALKRLKSK